MIYSTSLRAQNRHFNQGAVRIYDFIRDQIISKTSFGHIIDEMSYTRASDLTISDAQGNYSTFAANDVAQNDLGMVLQPSVNNLIKSSGMGGAFIGVVGSGGSLPTGWNFGDFDTLEVLDIGVEAGLPFIELDMSKDNISGGGTTYSSIAHPTITVNDADTWTYITRYKLISGTLDNNQHHSQIKVAGTSGTGYTDINVTAQVGVIQPVSASITISNTAPITLEYRMFKADLSVGEAFSAIIRLYAPQLEIGAYANNPVITGAGITGSSAPVVADNDVSAWDLSQATIVIDADINNMIGYAYLFGLDDDAANANRIVCYTNDSSSLVNFRTTVAGVTVTNGFAVPNGLFKFAIKYDASQAKLFVNGVLISTITLATAFGASVFKRLRFASPNGFGYVANGVYRHAVLYDQALTDTQCIEATV
ncbi:MAG: hypothetical protein HRU29_03070 [Rhizobiales bacterium]|nr:LamG domain-containing protein [Hyphomicrobiales bacterium]NRB13359.1 hypothetical protein [Hyphomicrobiales bacterium]